MEAKDDLHRGSTRNDHLDFENFGVVPILSVERQDIGHPGHRVAHSSRRIPAKNGSFEVFVLIREWSEGVASLKNPSSYCATVV